MYGLLELGSSAPPAGLGRASASASASARTAARALPVVPARSFHRRYPPVFCDLDAARARNIMSVYVSRIGGAGECYLRAGGWGCSGGRGARELSLYSLGIHDAASRSSPAPYSP